MDEKKKHIPLNIVMTYPVHWSRFQVLRDFVQNFYDSIGYDEWANRFQYKYENGSLHMWIKDVSFNYEWLMHIGASTKTANSDAYAGYFGEGFKIASLCAYRDWGWKISMFSDTWELEVCSCEKTIDDSNIEMLSYEIITKDKSDETKLVINNISKRDYETFLTVLNSFYYPENPIMGELLWKGKEGTVFLRSKKCMDINLPVTQEYGSKGAVFCGYQMLGTNPFNLVVCLHKYKKDDRERRGLYSFEIIKVFENICQYVDSKCAMVMLEKLRKYWNSYAHKKIDLHSWSYVVDILIKKVAVSEEYRKKFVANHNNLLYLKKIKSVSDQNKRGQAKAWLNQQEKHYILVKDTFKLLGYKAIEDECEQNGGFVIDDAADEIQKQCFTVLEELCESIFDDFFIIDRWPEQKIITNLKASYHGMAVIHKKKNRVNNNRGLCIRYDIGAIYLKKNIFHRNGFYDGAATYIHELCHMFGGDASMTFSQALTIAIETLMIHHKLVLEEKKKWEDIFVERLPLQNSSSSC